MSRKVIGMRAFSSIERRAIRAFLIEKYGTNCQLCNKPIDMTTQREDNSFSIDHIIALADGGSNEQSNMWPTHIACNERKGSGKVVGRVRTNRKPRTERVTHATTPRLAYSTSS